MNPSEKAIRDRAGYDPRFEMMMRRTPNKPRAQKPSKEQQPSPAEAGSLALRDFYGEAPGFEKVTAGGLVSDYGRAGLNLGIASLKHIPFGVGNILNGIDAVKDAFKLTGSIFTDGLFSQGTFKAAVDLTAHAIGTIPCFESVGAFYDQGKAIGDFFDAGANTVNYFRDAPKMRTSPALQALSGITGGLGFNALFHGGSFLGFVIAKAPFAEAAVSVGLVTPLLHTTLGGMYQSVKSAIEENRRLPRAAPLSA